MASLPHPLGMVVGMVGDATLGLGVAFARPGTGLISCCRECGWGLILPAPPKWQGWKETEDRHHRIEPKKSCQAAMLASAKRRSLIRAMVLVGISAADLPRPLQRVLQTTEHPSEAERIEWKSPRHIAAGGSCSADHTTAATAVPTALAMLRSKPDSAVAMYSCFLGEPPGLPGYWARQPTPRR